MGRFGDGIGTAADLGTAVEAAVAQAMAPLHGRTPDLAVAFVCGPDAENVGERALALTGARATLGCTAEGVMGAGVGVQDVSAVSVWVAELPGATLRTFHLEVLPADGAAAVVGVPEPRPDDDVMIVLADPFSFPVDGFLQQVARVLPGVPVAGALAHGAAGPGSTRLWVDGRTVGRGAVGVVASGTGARAVLSQGCRPVGPEMLVTEAAGNVVRGLSLERARDKVQGVLVDLPPGDQALASRGLYLGIAAAEGKDEPEYLVRSVVSVDQDGYGLVLAHPVEVGQTVRLHVRDADAADADLREALGRVRSPGSGALLLSCRGRGGGTFGPSYGGTSHDAQAVREALGADAVGGLFTAGEIGPVGERSWLHGFSASVVVFP
jgi:small ligand-binding sensory domain FIST